MGQISQDGRFEWDGAQWRPRPVGVAGEAVPPAPTTLGPPLATQTIPALPPTLAGGDLSGTDNHVLAAPLGDTSWRRVQQSADGQFEWDGTAWVERPAAMASPPPVSFDVVSPLVAAGPPTSPLIGELTMSATTGGQVSPDGAFEWDGAQWRPRASSSSMSPEGLDLSVGDFGGSEGPQRPRSPDGNYEWDGTRWVGKGLPPPRDAVPRGTSPMVTTTPVAPAVAGRPRSDDGVYEWDGTQWVAVSPNVVDEHPVGASSDATVSADGRYWWNGTAWERRVSHLPLGEVDKEARERMEEMVRDFLALNPKGKVPLRRRWTVGWELTKISWTVFGMDKALLVFPGVQMVLWIVLTALYFPLALAIAGGPLLYVAMFVYFCLTAYAGLMCSGALMHTTSEVLGGRPVRAKEAWREVGRHAGHLLHWAVLTAMFRMFKTVTKFVPGSDQVVDKGFDFAVERAVGAAWSICTAFIVPVLLYENLGMRGSMKRSAEIVTQRWGEEMVFESTTAIVFVMLGVCLAVIAVIAAFIQWEVALAVFIIGIGALILGDWLKTQTG